MLLSAGLGFLPAAQAQQLDAYRTLNGALSAAAAARNESAASALDQLNAADRALAELNSSLTDRQLASTLAGTLGEARAALARQPADLEAQTLHARALARQALYTQTTADLLQYGLNGETRPRLEQLAADFDLDQAQSVALLAAANRGDIPDVTTRLQQAAARQAVRLLEPWSLNATLSQSEAYLRLVQANGWHFILQEARDIPSTQAESYAEVIALVADREAAQAAPQIRALYFAALQTAQTRERAMQPVNLPPPSETAGADTTAASTTSLSEEEQLTAALYGTLARALTSAISNEQALTREQLQAAEALARALPQDWQGPQAEQLANHLASLSDRAGLRPGDIIGSMMEVRALERHVGGLPSDELPAQRWVATFWNGGMQALAFFLLSVLVPLPFYYKARALGRRGAAWRKVSFGIGLLLAPLVLEGIASVATWLGDVLGVSALGLLGNLSIRQSPPGQLAWWLLSLSGLILLILGFRQLGQPRDRLASARQSWDASRHNLEPGTTQSGATPLPDANTPSNKTFWQR